MSTKAKAQRINEFSLQYEKKPTEEYSDTHSNGRYAGGSNCYNHKHFSYLNSLRTIANKKITRPPRVDTHVVLTLLAGNTLTH